MYRLGIVLQVDLLLGLHLSHPLRKIFVGNFCGFSSQRNHSGLDANSFQLSSVKVVRDSGELLKVDVRIHVHLSGMDLQNSDSGLLVGVWELDLAI